MSYFGFSPVKTRRAGVGAFPADKHFHLLFFENNGIPKRVGVNMPAGRTGVLGGPKIGPTNFYV